MSYKNRRLLFILFFPIFCSFFYFFISMPPRNEISQASYQRIREMIGDKGVVTEKDIIEILGVPPGNYSGQACPSDYVIPNEIKVWMNDDYIIRVLFDDNGQLRKIGGQRNEWFDYQKTSWLYKIQNWLIGR